LDGIKVFVSWSFTISAATSKFFLYYPKKSQTFKRKTKKGDKKRGQAPFLPFNRLSQSEGMMNQDKEGEKIEKRGLSPFFVSFFCLFFKLT